MGAALFLFICAVSIWWSAIQFGNRLVTPPASRGKPASQPPISVELDRAYDAQVHEMIDAITAMVTAAQAGQNWLHAQPPNLEEIRQTLNNITNDGKRAYEIFVRLRARMKKASTVD